MAIPGNNPGQRARLWGKWLLGMRDVGLEEAIKAVGGVASLARGIGIAQPSVSAWSRVPADRVAAVEALTNVPRVRLRPDLYRGENLSQIADDVDAARAAEYGLLALLMGRAPDAATLSQIATLKGDGTDLGMAHVELAAAASNTDDVRASREFFNLFIGLGRGEILPYASYYLTGFLHERPLARVREDFERLGIERDGPMQEPEDHIAILCETMSAMARGNFPATFEQQKNFFERHIEPWAKRMFVDLEMASGAQFYRAVGRAGRVFMEVEEQAFALTE